MVGSFGWKLGLFGALVTDAGAEKPICSLVGLELGLPGMTVGAGVLGPRTTDAVAA